MKNKVVILISVVLLLITTAAVLAIGVLPSEQAKPHPGTVTAVAQHYQDQMEMELASILFADIPVKKEYSISPSAQAAPLPDPLCYGEADSPAQLQWLLDKAEPLLEGQTLYFSTDMEILEGSKVRYYLDDTILAITWKQVFEKAVFTFAEVKVLHPSQFRRHLSGGSFGSGTLSLTTEMAASVNAVVAGNGDYYAYRRKGVVVTNGTVHKAVRGVSDMCFIDNDGNMLLERDFTFEEAAEVQAYVDKHNVNFSLAFGPILIKDGENICPPRYNLGEIRDGYPRAAICQMDSLHYVFVVSNMEGRNGNNLRMKEFAAIIEQTGCRHAYALDGGQTATVVMNNQLINRVNYGSERSISDIIYFATAKPMGE